MKKSNKLLIVFAAALILVPLLGMIYVSRVKYEVGTYNADRERHVETLESASKELTKMESTAFQTVAIISADPIRISVYVVKDAKFGVKVSNDIKDQVKINVGADGQLHVNIKKLTDKQRGIHNADIFIFAPNVSALDLNSIASASIDVTQDSLNLKLQNAGNIYFDETATLKYLQVSATSGSDIKVFQGKISSMDLNLNETNFEAENTSFEKLVINSTGKAKISIEGDENNATAYAINDFVINTTGEAHVNLLNVKINKSAGKFSDETKLRVPAAVLNQMYLKR